MMYYIRIDLKRLLRAGGKLPAIVLLVMISALGWGFFGPMPTPSPDAERPEMIEAPNGTDAVSVPVGGIVSGNWRCSNGSDEWVPYKNTSAGMKAIEQGMIDYLLVCDSDESAALFSKQDAVEEMVGAGVMLVGQSDRTIRIGAWHKYEKGPSNDTFFAAIWAALAMLMVIPVRIAASLVFQERTSGRLEWVLANQMSLRQYACLKSVACTIGSVGLLILLWGCLFALGIAFIKFVLMNAAGGSLVYEQGQAILGEVISRGFYALVSAGANLVGTAFAVSVIAIRLFLASRFQLRVTTLTEMGILLVAFLPLGLPSAPQWFPLFGALTALEMSVAGETINWMSVAGSAGISVAIGLVSLVGLRPSRMLGR